MSTSLRFAGTLNFRRLRWFATCWGLCSAGTKKGLIAALARLPRVQQKLLPCDVCQARLKVLRLDLPDLYFLTLSCFLHQSARIRQHILCRRTSMSCVRHGKPQPGKGLRHTTPPPPTTAAAAATPAEAAAVTAAAAAPDASRRHRISDVPRTPT